MITAAGSVKFRTYGLNTGTYSFKCILLVRYATFLKFRINFQPSGLQKPILANQPEYPHILSPPSLQYNPRTAAKRGKKHVCTGISVAGPVRNPLYADKMIAIHW